MSTVTTTTNDPVTREALQRRACALRLHGLADHLDEIDDDALGQLHTWLGWEERTRGERGLARRLGAAHLGRFKALVDYDCVPRQTRWDWRVKQDETRAPRRGVRA